ncbi:MAG TPA: AIPR family protein [Acidobacteriaceae bacterium]|jgi:hypothetical protein|nr:AIPR family protein [Acidobacteriaceae bacterium]
MDRVSESLLKEFSEERGILHLPEDKRFEHFVAAITIGRHYSDTFDADDALVGTATGIDAVAIIVNNSLVTDVETLEEFADEAEIDVTFVFVQADRGSGFDVGKMGNIGFAVADFFKEIPTLPRTPEITAAAATMAKLYQSSAKFKRGNPVCRIYYATTGTWTNDATLEGRRQSIIAELMGTNLFRDVTFTPLGADGIQRLYRQTKNAIQREFLFEQRMTIPDIPGVTQAYLGFLPVPELLKILTDDTGEMIGGLFYSNPRDWQGYNDVNSEIKGTLESETRSQFVLKNNGITIIARDVRPTANKFVIEDYQIVNGCQTCHVLFEQADKIDRSVAVPIRLIGTQDEGVINSIIRGTNRQTQVTDEQFFALEEFPKQLEAYFQAFPPAQKLYYERRSRQYERLQIEKTRIVTQPNVIKAFAAMFLEEAHRTTRNYAALKSKVGKEIFGKGHRKESYYAAAYAYYRLEYMFRSGKLDRKFKPARFHILLALRLIANTTQLPAMNSREMDAYCKPIIDFLNDPNLMEAHILVAAGIVEEAAGGNFDRDSIRTEPMTKRVKSISQDYPGKLAQSG